MAVSKHVREHWKIGYAVIVEPVPHIRGLKVTMPPNIFIGADTQTYIYELDGTNVNIYNGSRKIESYFCPEYAGRNFILHDINAKLQYYGIDPDLIQILKDGKKFKYGGILELMTPPEDTQQQDKEKELNNYIINGQSYNQPPRGIEDGCKILFEHFFKEKN